MNDIRLIAMDLDGTLLQRDGTILPETVSALQAAADCGVTLALASGRYPENASLYFMDHGLTGPVMGSNGAMLTDRPMGQTVALHTMREATASAVRRNLDAIGAEYFIFSHKLVVTSRQEAVHHSEINDGPRISRLGKVQFLHGPEGVDTALAVGVCKYYVFIQENLPRIMEAVGHIPDLLVTRSGQHNIELMPAGVHKGSGIAELAARLRIPLSQVMAFGDEENDLEMLTSVGYGIAMGNAPEQVRSRVSRTTAPFDQNGIAQAIRKYILNGEG